jgi:hypothetical protein
VSEGSTVLESVAGAAADCGGRAASDPTGEAPAALAAPREHGARSVVVLGFEERAGAALDLGAGTAVAALGHGQGGEAALLAAARDALSAGARLTPRGSAATAGGADQPDRRMAAARLCAAITAAAPVYWPATACAGRHHCSCAAMP